MIEFNQNDWQKLYIDVKTDLRRKAKNDFECSFKVMNNTVFGKPMENVRQHRDIKLVATKRRRNHLVSKPNYLTKRFSQNISQQKKQKKETEMLMNKPICLTISIPELHKMLLHEFWCVCMNQIDHCLIIKT